MLSPVGTGAGGVVVAIALVYLLAHLDVISAMPEVNEGLQRMLVATVIPLGLTFAGIVIFRSIQII